MRYTKVVFRPLQEIREHYEALQKLKAMRAVIEWGIEYLEYLQSLRPSAYWNSDSSDGRVIKLIWEEDY